MGVPWLVFDLDRPEGPVEALRDAARLVNHVRDSFGLRTMDFFRVNFSGSKGCHVRILNPDALLHGMVRMDADGH